MTAAFSWWLHMNHVARKLLRRIYRLVKIKVSLCLFSTLGIITVFPLLATYILQKPRLERL